MKRFLTNLVCVVMAVLMVFGLASCKKPQDDNSYTLYVPDGAPALSVARLLNTNNAVENLNIKVVQASMISSYVTGENPKADFAIMPVNACSKLLGSAKDYKMLGVVTHGNLFLMKKANGVNITTSNLSELIGKKVGVINLTNVPGLTFKAILAQNNIPFTSEVASFSEQTLNLVALADGMAVTPNSECDYFVVPEPAMTTKQNATQGKLSLSASLQELYGGTEGYPQAVLVGKNSVISTAVAQNLINSFSQNQAWLTDANTKMEDIISAVKSGYIDDFSPTFSAQNLNATVINNCAIKFIDAQSQKQSVLAYLQKINAISANAWGTPVDEFFYK